MARRSLLIGVSEYGEGFDPLPGSLLDVRGMAAALGNPQQGAFGSPLVLENPDLSRMTAEIEQFLGGAGKDDLLLLYFSGHGDLGQSVAQQRLHLCAAGTRKQQRRLVESSAMSADFLKRQMDLCKSRQIVVILDCCYSGAIADLLRKGEGRSALEELKAEGRVILASSSADESSYQAVDGLSLYTHYLLEGMAGAAQRAGERSEWIVARDLHAYAVQKLEVEQKGGVSPKIIVARDAGYDLAIVRAPKADPLLEYGRAVDKLFRELDDELGVKFDGQINDSLDLGSLETLAMRLGVDEGAAQQVLLEVQAPYLVRANRRGKYWQYFEQAVSDGFLPSERSRRRLEEICQNLLLGPEDATQIEKLIEQERQLKLRAVPKPEQKTPDPSPKRPGARSLGVKRETPGVLETPGVWAEDLGQGIKLEMVRIPAGKFLMGSPQDEAERTDAEGPQHLVQVPEFFLGKHTVTQAQWKQVAGLPKVQRDLKADPAYFKGANRPVESVSWDDAQEFCARLSKVSNKTYRLPSEAEWEYACRAGTTTPFHFGETISTDQANYRGQDVELDGMIYSGKYGSGKLGVFREQTTEVGSFPANGFGLHDMHGNVWEWCEDEWHKSYEGAPTDGSAWKNNEKSDELDRLLRGGSWDYYPWFCRSAVRFGLRRDYSDFSTGFRVACRALPRT